MNKPVAYIDPYDLERLPHYDCHIGSQQLKNGIPLYTHPVDAVNTSQECVDKTQNNRHEPVAWINKTGSHGYLEWDKDDEVDESIPLYTHPVKELTDKEIYEVWFKYGCGMPWTANTKTFIRAILRKAQEK